MLTPFGKRKKRDSFAGVKFAKVYIPKPKVHRPRREHPGKAQARKVFLTKRRKFVVVAGVLAIGMFGIQAVSLESRYLAIGLFGLASYILCAWSMLKDLRGIQWVTNLILPVLYPVSIALFYFLLPQSLALRVGVNLIFAITMYALLLTANIFAVASIRTIQLLRAARAVGFLLSILTSALFFQVIFALRLPAWVVGMLVFVTSFLIFFHGVWSHVLSIKGGKKELTYTIIGAAIMLQASVAMSFWLIDVALASIMLAMIMYVLLGLFQQDLEERLFRRTIQEYMGFAVIVFLVVVSTVIVKWLS